MDTSPISGFITRKQAAERCRRAERTLQRYWSRAIEHRDAKVLDHLKLHAEDGRTIEGPDVTKELIEQLKRGGQNPTWYVHAEWVQQTYGPRTDEAKVTPQSPSKAPAAPSEGEAAGGNDTLTILKEQLEKKEAEIGYLRDELNIKNEQIRDANERTRESNVLMRELQRMLGDWQDQAFRTLPAGRTGDRAVVADQPQARTEEASDAESAKPEKGSRRQGETAAKSAKKRSRSPSKKPATKQPGMFEKHTPTFHKAFSGLFRR